MAEQNNCVNCRKMSSCRLKDDIEKVTTPYLDWFSDAVELVVEVEEAIGKQCLKFVENGG